MFRLFRLTPKEKPEPKPQSKGEIITLNLGDSNMTKAEKIVRAVGFVGFVQHYEKTVWQILENYEQLEAEQSNTPTPKEAD